MSQIGYFGISWLILDSIFYSRGFIEFIKRNFYATTKGWHTHQNIRLGELVWHNWVSELFMESFIELTKKCANAYSCGTSYIWHCFPPGCYTQRRQYWSDATLCCLACVEVCRFVNLHRHWNYLNCWCQLKRLEFTYTMSHRFVEVEDTGGE